MANERLTSLEKMIIQVADAFSDLLVAEQVSVKRFSDLVFAGAVQALKKKGLSMQEIISHSGAAAKTVKKYLRDEYHDKKGDILVVRFLSGWAADTEMPKELSLSGENFPDWQSVCSRHGGELTPNFLKRTLLASGNISIRGDRVSLVTENYANNGHSGVTYDYVGWVLAHHIKSISHNVNHPTDPLLERTIYGFQVKPERREELREFWREELSVALAKARETAKDKGFYDSSLPKDNEIGVTVFMWDDQAPT